MISFDNYLKKELKNPKGKEAYEQERKLIELAMEVKKTREKEGLTQADLARKARITQQQLSKVENGISCNITTFLKVAQALHLNFSLSHQRV